MFSCFIVLIVMKTRYSFLISKKITYISGEFLVPDCMKTIISALFILSSFALLSIG